MSRLITLGALIVCTFAPTTAEAASAYTSTVGRGRYVVSSSVSARSIPSTRGRYMGRLYRGNEVFVYGISGSWARVYVKGKRSFVTRTSLRKKVTAPRPPTASRSPSSHPARTTRVGAGSYVTKSSVNVRSGPSTSYSRLGALRAGQRITVFGIGGNWARFSFSGASRYVHKNYIRRATTSSPPATARPAPRPTDTVARTTTAGKGTYEATTSAGSVRINPVSSSTKVGSLTKGRRYTVRGIGKSYARISFGGVTRYTARGFLKKVSTTTTPHPAYATTAGRGTHLVNSATGLSVRSGPGSTFAVVGRVRETVYVHGKARGWARITYAKRTRFVASSTLRSIARVPGVAHSLRYEVGGAGSVLRRSPSTSSSLDGRLARRATVQAMRRSGNYIGLLNRGVLRWASIFTLKTIPVSSGRAVAREHYKPTATTTLRVSPNGALTNVRAFTGSHLYSKRESGSWILVELVGRTAGWISKSRVERRVDTTRPAYTAYNSSSNTWSRGNSDFALGVDGNASVSHSRERAGGSGRMRAFVKVFGKKVTIATLRSSVSGKLGGNLRTLTQDGIRIISVLGDSPFSHGNTLAVDYSIAENVFGVKPEFRVPVLGIPVRVAFDATVGLSLSSERRATGGGWDASSSLSLSAGISGEIGVDVFVAGAGVGGEVSVSTGPSIDFTLRPESGASADLGVSAGVGGRVYLYARIGKGFLSYTKDVTLISYTLASTRATLTQVSARGN